MEEKFGKRRDTKDREGSFVLPSTEPIVIPLIQEEEEESNEKDRNLSRFRFGKWNKLKDRDKKDKEKQIIRQELRLQTRKKSKPHTNDHEEHINISPKRDDGRKRPNERTTAKEAE